MTITTVDMTNNAPSVEVPGLAEAVVGEGDLGVCTLGGLCCYNDDDGGGGGGGGGGGVFDKSISKRSIESRNAIDTSPLETNHETAAGQAPEKRQARFQRSSTHPPTHHPSRSALLPYHPPTTTLLALLYCLTLGRWNLAASRRLSSSKKRFCAS